MDIINPTLLYATLSCFAGLILLYFGGNKLVDGAVFVAEKLKVSTLFIGVAIIGLGTSLPEIIATASAVRLGTPDVAFGNIIGSNIANIGLVLGLGLLLVSRITTNKAQKQEYLFMMVGMVLFSIIVFLNNGIPAWAGVVLLLTMVVYLYISLRSGRNSHGNEAEMDEELALPSSPWLAAAFIIGGLVALFIGADLMVDGAVTIAKSFGISERVIGLTLVAIGTSLPEIAATIAAARHGNIGLTLGNVAGSNTFNALAAGGAGALVGHMNTGDLTTDLLTMLAFGCAMAYIFLAPKANSRIFGAIIMLGYVGYLVHLAL